MRCLIIFILAAVFYISASAQMPELKVDNLSSNDGLPTDNVLYTYQDSYGFLWLASYEGLIRWDGANYKRYFHSQGDSTSLSGNIVYKIIEDHKRRLWVGTIDGLNLFDRAHEKFIRCDIGKETTKIPVNDIREDSRRQLWLGTSYGLCRYDHDSGTSKWFVNDPANPNSLSHDVIFRLSIDLNDDLWIATFGGGVSKFSPQTGVFTRLQHEENDATTVCSNKIKSILADKEGRIWVGSFDKGVTLLDSEGKVLRQYQYTDKLRRHRIQGDVTCIYEDANNTIWLGIKGQVLHYKKKDSDEFVAFGNSPYMNPGLQCVSITSICEDTFGNIFFASQSHGLFRTNVQKNLFRHLYKGRKDDKILNHNVVTSLHEDRSGNIWIASDGGGLTRLGPGQNELTSYTTADGLSSNAIMEVREDDRGYLWLATWSGGVMKFNPATGGVQTFMNNPADANSLALNNVKSILPQDTLVWIGTHGEGLSVYDTRNRRFINQRNNNVFPFNLKTPAWINHLAIDSRGRLWVSTYGGLYLYDNTTLHHFTPSDAPSSISSDFVNMVAEAPDKSIWVISESGGLDRFIDTTHGFEHYTEQYGLPRSIKGITFDHSGTMWLSSNEGITGFDVSTKEIVRYDQTDGLQGNSFFHKSILTASNGNLYIGGPNGVNSFNPDSLRVNRKQFESSVYLTDLYIYDELQTLDKKGSPLEKVLAFTDTLVLRPEQSFFTIGYASLNLYSNSKTQYAYKLEGLHDNWINMGSETKAAFTQLNPGAYVFRLRYTDAEGAWHEAAKDLHIVILPPWWKTWWFRTLMVLGTVSLVIAFFYLRMSSIKKQNRLLEQEVARRTYELSEANSYLVEKNEEINLQNEKLEEFNREILRQSDKILVQQEQNLAQNQQLEKTVQELHRSNQTKDRFFSILAHDLRNPVATLSGLAESLKNNLVQLSKNDISEYVDSVYKSSQSVYTLLVNLLSWARTQSHDIQYSPVDFDVAGLIRKNVALMEQQFRNKNIAVSFSSLATHKVYADYNMIDTVIRNLLMNSVKFTHAGGRVEIFCEERGGETVLRVRDTGIGMTPEQLADLFKIEKKSLAIGTAGETGTGLGLVITKEFVEANKGKLKLISSRGIGSEFFVHLPQSIVAVEAHEGSEIPFNVFGNKVAHEFPLEKLVKLKGKRLLIVDDNRELRYYLRRDLSGTFEIFEAGDGNEGLKMALEVQPTVIITDMIMPVMDGEKFCKELKALPATSHIPVILLTNQSYEEGQAIGYRAGADVYLTKPAGKELLFQVIYNFLRTQEKMHRLFLNTGNYFPDDVSISKVDEDFLQQVVSIIERNLSEPGLDYKLICEETALSRTILYAKIKALTGLGVNEFIRSIRLKKSLTLLREGKLNVSQVAYEVGFNSQSYFHKCFIKQYNISPRDYWKNPSKLSEVDL